MTKPRTYEPLSWQDGSVRYLDQVELPRRTSYSETRSYQDIIDAIRRLSIRGAPLIGIAGAYAVVLASEEHSNDIHAFERALELIANARPTAVNLRYAVDRLRSRLEGQPAARDRRTSLLLEEAWAIHDETRSADRAISERGAALFPSPAGILTICNTGPLATGGDGTAFGVIAETWRRGHVRELFVCETRPLLQGARLTLWELQQLGIPSTLLNDSAAATLFSRGMIDAVIVGADRIAANGDTANKVGTLTLACLSEKYGVPLYVAAPSSTIDPHTPDGASIPIEFRGPDEVTSIAGTPIAPDGTKVFSPAFDVTPAEMVSAIVTEDSIHRRPFVFSRPEGSSVAGGTK